MTRTPLEFWIAQKIGAADTRHLTSHLASYQLHMVQETLRYARSRSPFYRRHLKMAAHTISKPQDISTLPFTTADDIKENGMQFLCVSQGEIERVVTLQSTGTTGKPKRLYFTAEDIELTLDFFAVGMSTFTRPGHRVLILLPGETPDSVGDLLARSLDRIGACSVKHGPVRNAAHTLAVMQQERITCLVGIPTQVLWLARCSKGLPLKITSVLLTTDYVPDTIRTAVENAWGCRVYNHYGMTEMGLGGGVDCAARQSYHLREADLYFEIINPETGAPQPEGELGEVVFTTLTRTGMPLIRYRTGDLARMLAKPCPCGTTLRCMGHIHGRVQQLVMLRNGCRLAFPDLDEALFSVSGLLDYRATVVQSADACRLQLQLRTAPDRSPDLLSKIRNALFSSATLQQSFLDGSLLLESVVFRDETWLTDGMSKRALTIINS
jgi:phenylacetate-CoA ligase